MSECEKRIEQGRELLDAIGRANGIEVYQAHQKAFWAAYEIARSFPDDNDIRLKWNEYVKLNNLD